MPRVQVWFQKEGTPSCCCEHMVMIAAAHQWVSAKHYMKVEEKEKKV